jgi:DNA-binding LacI/PurR family transcriptional regulator
VEQEVPFTAFAGWAPVAVVLDAEEVIRQGVKMLASQGCRRIGFWMPRDQAVPEPGTSLPDHCPLTRVFQQSLELQGLRLDENLVKNNWHRLTATTRETFAQQGYRVAREVFQGDGPRPDGVVVTDDTMTHGALLALARLGVELGTDLKIASHSNRNAPVFLDHQDAIGRLEFDPLEVVERLFEVLESLMLKQPLRRPTSPFKGTNAIMIPPRVVLPPGENSAVGVRSGHTEL